MVDDSKDKKGGAFTILELMVACAIFLAVMGLVAVSFVQVSRSISEGKEISAKQNKQRFCLFWMSKEIASIVGATDAEKKYILKAQDKSFFFIYAKEANLAEARYACNLSEGVLEHYTQEPTDYDLATYQRKEICLEDLTECAFSYSDGSSWSADLSEEKNQLPRSVKITYKFKDTDRSKEFLVNIPLSQ